MRGTTFSIYALGGFAIRIEAAAAHDNVGAITRQRGRNGAPEAA
jgi:hypothetical protein